MQWEELIRAYAVGLFSLCFFILLTCYLRQRWLLQLGVLMLFCLCTVTAVQGVRVIAPSLEDQLCLIIMAIWSLWAIVHLINAPPPWVPHYLQRRFVR